VAARGDDGPAPRSPDDEPPRHLLRDPSPTQRLASSPRRSGTTLHRGRRRLSSAAASIAIVATPALLAVSPAPSKALEAEAAAAVAPCLAELPVTAKAFLDVSISGEPAGHITVGLFRGRGPVPVPGDGRGVPAQGVREGGAGYVQHDGVVSYLVVPTVTERLAAEAEAVRARCGAGAVHAAAGAVSIPVITIC
jgi:peptidyl-prolyl cis-trans isomerase B (cyclophilin B)